MATIECGVTDTGTILVVLLCDADILEKKRQDLDQLPVEQHQVQEVWSH